jgi:hypothetical protein
LRGSLKIEFPGTLFWGHFILGLLFLKNRKREKEKMNRKKETAASKLKRRITYQANFLQLT